MADRFNYMAPVMKCQLEGKSGTVLDFKSWSSSYSTKSDLSIKSVGGGALGGAAQAVNYPYLTQLSVTLMGLGIDAARGAVMTNTISLTIEPPYDQWIELIEDYVDVFTDGTLVSVQLGYSGTGDEGLLSEEFKGVLTVVGVDLSPDFVSMSLTAAGNLWYMTRRQGSLNTFGRTIIEVIREIADSHAAQLYYLDDKGDEIRLSGSTPSTLSSLDNPIIEVIQGDDYQMILELIQGHANLDFYTVGSRLIIYSQEAQAKQTFVPTFVFRGGPLMGSMPIEKGVYPCLSFSNIDTQSVIKRAAAAVGANVTDLDTKAVEQIRILKGDTGLAFQRPFSVADSILGADITLPGGGATSSGDDTVPMTMPHRDDQLGLLVPMGDSDPSAKSKLIGLKRLAETLSGLESSWSTLGNPRLRPGQDANVRGTSKLFDGRYSISKIVHTGSLSGYETQVDGKTIGKYSDEAPGTEDTKGKASQATDPEPQSAGSGIDTQVKTIA